LKSHEIEKGLKTKCLECGCLPHCLACLQPLAVNARIAYRHSFDAQTDCACIVPEDDCDGSPQLDRNKNDCTMKQQTAENTHIYRYIYIFVVGHGTHYGKPALVNHVKTVQIAQALQTSLFHQCNETHGFARAGFLSLHLYIYICYIYNIYV
jgi:hypothetical protein